VSSPIATLEGYSGLMASLVRGLLAGANGTLVRLFANNLYPTQASVWTDFEEASFAGYAPQPFSTAIDQGLNPDAVDVWRFAAVAWTLTALPTQVVYGYWIDWINPVTSLRQSLWCQRFDSPYLFDLPSRTLTLVATPGFSQGV
jgi:hypothetical protein